MKNNSPLIVRFFPNTNIICIYLIVLYKEATEKNHSWLTKIAVSVFKVRMWTFQASNPNHAVTY